MINYFYKYTLFLQRYDPCLYFKKGLSSVVNPRLIFFRRRHFGWSIKKTLPGVVGIIEFFVQRLTFSLVNHGNFWDTYHLGLVKQWVNWIITFSRETNRTIFPEYVAELFKTHTSNCTAMIYQARKLLNWNDNNDYVKVSIFHPEKLEGSSHNGFMEL
jgi:hypothetical protein